MLNLRDKNNPNKVYRLLKLNYNLSKVDYLGKDYLIPSKPTLHCKGIGFSKEALFNLEDVRITHLDNPGMTPIRSINVFKLSIERNSVSLYYCLAMASKTREGNGIGEIYGKIPVGSFESVDMLRVFAKKHNINLIN